MDIDQGSMPVSSPPRRQRPPTNWVPFPGTKRKAHVANLGDNFDADCRPSPAKQFAVDEEVANDILQDGVYFDPLQPLSPPESGNERSGNESDTEDAPGVYGKAPGDTTDIPCTRSPPVFESMFKTTVSLNEEEGHDDSVIAPHSMHVSQINSSSNRISSNSQSVVKNAFSIILSNEIQETLTQGKRNEDFPLPKSIINHVRKTNNSMALVPWKPPMSLENLTMFSSIKPKEMVVQGKILCFQQNLEPVFTPVTPPPVPLLSVANQQTSEQPIFESLLFQSIAHDEDSMDMDVDIPL